MTTTTRGTSQGRRKDSRMRTNSADAQEHSPMAKSKPHAKRKKPGRPTLFMADDHCQMAREYSGNGKTMVQLAEAIGVHVSTIFEWQRNYPAFSDAFTQGREAACDSVEASLFQRAIGYSKKITKLVVVSTGGRGGSKVERHDVIEHYPPDVAAIRFFLNNRRPDSWKERQAVEHSGSLTLEQVLSEANKPVQTLAANHP